MKRAGAARRGHLESTFTWRRTSTHIRTGARALLPVSDNNVQISNCKYCNARGTLSEGAKKKKVGTGFYGFFGNLAAAAAADIRECKQIVCVYRVKVSEIGWSIWVLMVE